MTTNKHEPAEYLAIRLWHKQTGSFEYYVTKQQERAAIDGAPLDAIFKRDWEGQSGWVAVSDLSHSHPFHKEYAYYLETHHDQHK